MVSPTSDSGSCVPLTATVLRAAHPENWSSLAPSALHECLVTHRAASSSIFIVRGFHAISFFVPFEFLHFTGLSESRAAFV